MTNFSYFLIAARSVLRDEYCIFCDKGSILALCLRDKQIDYIDERWKVSIKLNNNVRWQSPGTFESAIVRRYDERICELWAHAMLLRERHGARGVRRQNMLIDVDGAATTFEDFQIARSRALAARMAATAAAQRKQVTCQFHPLDLLIDD